MFCPSCALGLVERAVEGVGAPGERALTSRVGTWTVGKGAAGHFVCMK